VIGKTFSEPVLARVVDLPETDLRGAMTSLTGAEFLYEEVLYPQAEYAFKHRLTQEVAYTSQLSDRRSRTHAAVARVIAELEAAKLDEQAALLAYHWEQAGDALEAAGWHRRAAEWAGMNHPDEALRHWQSVRRLLGSVAETPAVLVQRAIACAQAMSIVMRAGGSPEELEALSREGTALAARTEEPHAVALVLHACGFLKAMRGQPDALDAIRGAVRAADANRGRWSQSGRSLRPKLRLPVLAKVRAGAGVCRGGPRARPRRCAARDSAARIQPLSPAPFPPWPRPL
jgi:predicted ATPase